MPIFIVCSVKTKTMKTKFSGALPFSIGMILLFSITSCFRPATMEPPVNLRCNYQAGIAQVDVEIPGFSWEVNDPARGAVQTACQVLVSTGGKFRKKDIVWNSGKVQSGQSVLVSYSGIPLESGKTYCWKVRTWDRKDRKTAFSEISVFETGLYEPGDWQARWIGKELDYETFGTNDLGNWIWLPGTTEIKSLFFRKKFVVEEGKSIERAVFRSTADHEYTAWINGVKVATGKNWNHVSQSEVKKRLRLGENIIALSATNADSTHFGVLGSLFLKYSDGTMQLISGDKTWLCADAVLPGWQNPGYEDGSWQQAAVIAPYGKGYWRLAGLTANPPKSVLVRNELEIPGEIAKAKAYVSGLGNYVLSINGNRVGDYLFTPGWTDYIRRVQYQAYDVTGHLKTGKNALGAILGNMWWSSGLGWTNGASYSQGPLRFLMQLHVTLKSGEELVFVTDENWQTSNSPITENTLYGGEHYDARLEQPGWDQPGFDAEGWEPVILPSLEGITLSLQKAPPIRITEDIKPVAMNEVSPGVYVYDMGQNMVGWVQLRLEGEEGTRVQLRFAEVLNDDGTLYTENLRSAKVTDSYTLKGAEPETWEPMFTYHGFRYVEITGFPGVPDLYAIVGKVLHNDAPPAGTFTCSSDLINRVYHAITWGQRGNMHSVPTDCPQRDERLGWMGDAQIFAPTSIYNMNMAAFYTKWMRDIRDSQDESGFTTDVCPAIVVSGPAKPGWGDAVVVIPWEVYRFYGDTGIIRENFDAMYRWVKYMERMSKDDLYQWGDGSWGGYGDWVAPVESPKNPIASAYYYHSADLLARMARIIGKTDVSEEMENLCARIKPAFNAKYFNPETGWYQGNTQTANLLPLAFGMVPEEHVQKVIANVAGDVEKRGVHLSTGFLGTRWLCPMLSDHGYHELAYQLAVQTTYPSWGYMVENGATTIWELWNSDTEGPSMNSRNHFAHGVVGEWYYSHLAGIRPLEEKPGFREFVVAPQPAGDLSMVDATYRSEYDMIRSFWEYRFGDLHLRITIPPNTKAAIHLPLTGPENATVTEGQEVIFSESGFFPVPGLESAELKDGVLVVAAGAGEYEFVIK